MQEKEILEQWESSWLEPDAEKKSNKIESEVRFQKLYRGVKC